MSFINEELKKKGISGNMI